MSSGSLFSGDDIPALFGGTHGEVTSPDQACSRPQQAQPKRAYPKCRVAREEFALEAAAVDMSSGCVEKPTVAWIHRDYWPNGLPVIQQDVKGGGNGDGRELVPGMFYVNGFEGRDGDVRVEEHCEWEESEGFTGCEVCSWVVPSILKSRTRFLPMQGLFFRSTCSILQP